MRPSLCIRATVAVAALAVLACSEHDPAGPPSGDHTPPSIASVVGWDVNHIVVYFDERVTRQTAEDPANYHIAEYTPPGGPRTTGAAVLAPSNVYAAALHSDNRTVTLTTIDMQDGTYALAVTGVSDVSGNYVVKADNHPFDGTGESDTTPPEVVYQSPAPGAVGVSTGGFVLIEFSEAVKVNTLISGLDVTGGDGVRMVSIAYEDQLHYACDLDFLKANTLYSVSITGVRDTAGNQMPDVQWTFQTEETYDVKSPAVVSSTPANRAVRVATDTNLSFTFSEPMDPYSVKLRPPVDFDAKHWSNGFRTVTYQTTWRPETQYTVQIRPGEMRDAAGNAGAQLFTLTFSTGGVLATGSLAGKIAGDPNSAKADDPTGGLVFAGVQSAYDLYTSVVGMVGATDSYEIPRLAEGTYFPFYVMDSNGDRLFQPNYGDAIGIYGVTDWEANQPAATVYVGSALVGAVDFRIFDPSAVYGLISYDGPRDGPMYVGLFATDGFDPLTSVPVLENIAEWNGTWAYIINSLVNGPVPDGEYYVAAYMDADRNAFFDPANDPMGVYGGATPIAVDLSHGNDAPGASIVLKDPVPGANATAVRWPLARRSDRLKPYLDALDHLARN